MHWLYHSAKVIVLEDGILDPLTEAVSPWVIVVICFLCPLLSLIRGHNFPCALPVMSAPTRHASAVKRAWVTSEDWKDFIDLCFSKINVFPVYVFRICVTSKSNMLPMCLLSDGQESNKIVFQIPQTSVSTHLNRKELLKPTYHKIMVYHVRTE